MTVEYHREVQLNQSNIIINIDWFVVIWMFDNSGDISNLFGTVSIIAMSVTKADAVLKRQNIPEDTAGCSSELPSRA